jgi:hypothetical protein
MHNRIIGSMLSLALLSSSAFAQTNPATSSALSQTPAATSFLDQVKMYLGLAAGGLAYSFRHRFGENAIAGNDRIIFSTYYKRDEAFYEGSNLGGTVLGAIAQCNAAKDLYEKHYEPGICDRIKEYAPGTHDFENAVWDATLKYVIAPAAVVGAVTFGITTYCVHKKLKQS